MIAVCAIAALSISPFFRPSLSGTLPGYLDVDDHTIVFGSNENEFLWAILFPNSDLTLIGTNNFELADGTSIIIGNRQVSILRPQNSKTLKLKHGRVFVFDSSANVRYFDDVSGLRVEWETFFNRWIGSNETEAKLILPNDFYSQIDFNNKHVQLESLPSANDIGG